jgi:hypothetical protein
VPNTSATAFQILSNLIRCSSFGLRREKLDEKFSRIPRNRWTQEVKRKLDGLLAAKKLRLDGHLKLLGKVVGDQRSVGIEGEDGELPQLTLRVVRGTDDPSD